MALGRGPQLIPRSFGLFASEDEHFGLCAAGDPDGDASVGNDPSGPFAGSVWPLSRAAIGESS